MATEQVTLVLNDKSILNSWRSVNAVEPKQSSARSKENCISGPIFSTILFGVIVLVMLCIFQYSNSAKSLPARSQDDITKYLVNQTLAEYLEKEVRVLCWIMTSPKRHKSKAVHVKRTWGKRCTKLLFVTTQADEELETLIIDIEEKYENLWGKTRRAFKYLYENHLDDYDWFLKADDDTYVFVENLRYMLYEYSPKMPVWFGFNFKLGGFKEMHRGYMSGGSGYILSREALRRFGSIALNSPTGCKLNDNTGAEDAEMGICLNFANVISADSRDASLKFRYNPFTPYGLLMSNVWGNDFWFQRHSFFHVHMSREALSPFAVAFHYVTPEEMHMFEYIKYEFEAIGLEAPKESLPRKLHNDEVIAPISDNELGRF